MAFFESADALVPGDVDGVLDVYEWEAQGSGGCQQAKGCLHLISSGHSATANYLYAMTPDGHDVFFTTSDLLLGSDKDGTPSVYDARIGGGFAEAEASPCHEGDTCKGPAGTSPQLPSAASATFSGPGNERSGGRRCAKGKRRIARHGKAVCIKKHRKHRHKRRAGQ